MKKQTITIIIFVLLLIDNSFPQGVAINITGASADSSAGLDIQFDNKGVLIPRMTTVQRNAIIMPAIGLQIFNTTTMCFEYFAYGIWQTGNCAICPIPLAADTITGISNVCQGDNNVSYFVPIISNATNYIWSYTGTGATINGTSNNITIDFSINATSGILTVKGNNFCGDGIVSADFLINVNVPVSVTYTGILPNLCETETIFDLSSTGTVSPTGGTYSGNGVIGTNFNPQLAGTGTHAITYSIINGTCISSATNLISVDSTPSISYTGNLPEQCENFSDLDLTNVGLINPLGGTFSGNGVTNSFFNPQSAGSGNHTITYTIINGACSNTSTNSIIVNNTPTEPQAGSISSSATEINWNWQIVVSATGYKYNTINDYNSAIDNGVSTNFTQTGLSCNNSYILYVWAYNTWCISNPSLFNKNTSSCFNCGVNTINDIDGNTYNTVLIGTQCWMKENLKTSKYSDGSVIPNITDNSQWANNVSGATCCMNNNCATYESSRGKLYNWFASSNINGLCPNGWHIPTDQEWCTMENFMEPGVDQNCITDGWRGNSIGHQLKEVGTQYWNSPNYGTDTHGFSARPSGIRDNNGSFMWWTLHGWFWTSTEIDGTNSYMRGVHQTLKESLKAPYNKNNGFAIRCIMN